MTEVAILSYHKLGPPAPGGWETWFYIPERTFADHLAALRDGGWRPVDAAAFMAGIGDPERLPDRTALITFDDGYRSVREVALPWLARFGWPAVLFMPSDFVGRGNDWDHGSEPREPLCDWDDLRELGRSGVSIQSHGASHRPFSELSPADRRDELERSKAALEGGLGEAVELFAYPYGDDGDGAVDVPEGLERAGYRAACGYGGDPFALPAPDPYRLARLALGPDTDLRAAFEGDGDARGS